MRIDWCLSRLHLLLKPLWSPLSTPLAMLVDVWQLGATCVFLFGFYSRVWYFNHRKDR